MKRLTNTDFVLQANIVHNSKYNYSESNYINSRSLIMIICNHHGSFYQKANNHLMGQGCPTCSKKKKLTSEIFIQKANTIHNNKYHYSLVKYVSSKKKVEIICKKHGSFHQTPNDHLSGKGCMNCSGKKRKTTIDFIEQANIIHDNKYNYSLVNYVNSQTKIKIICITHGIFLQTPSSHLIGAGCNKCSYNCISKMESIWLDYLKVPEDCRQQSITVNNKKYRVDAYNMKTNTIYEFYGDFWHGNIKKYNSNDLNIISNKSFGTLYNNTIQREKIFKDNGYNLITIWEQDFKKGNYSGS